MFTLEAVDTAGRRLRVKVYGRDAYDNQLLSKVWRTLWYRDGGPALELRRKEGAEHEAFVTLLAANAQVPTERVVTAGVTATDDSILVLETRGRTLATVGEVDDGVIGAAWQTLARLHEQHIAHLRIDTNTIVVTDDGVLLADLGSATVAPTADQLATDRSQLLADERRGHRYRPGTRLGRAGDRSRGHRRAAAVPADGRVRDGPADRAEGRRRRRRRAAQAGDRAGGRRAAHARTAAAHHHRHPRPAGAAGARGGRAHRRVRQRRLRGPAQGPRGRQRGDGSRAGFLFVQTTRLLQAAATRAAVPAQLPYGPVYAMQLAIGFMNVALPSAVARMAVNIRFFQRQGVSPPVAVTAGAIDSFAGNVVQVLLLVLLLVFSPYSVNLDLDAPSGDSGGNAILTVLVILLVASIAAMLLVPRIRNAIGQRVRRWWPEIRAAIGSLAGSSKLLVIVFANIGAELVFAASLGLFARALGYDLPLAQLLVINLSVSLFASLIPVPGGIGVTEGALMVGLAAAGLPDSTALAVTMLYRVLDLLPAAGVGLVRDALAPAPPVPLGTLRVTRDG